MKVHMNGSIRVRLTAEGARRYAAYIACPGVTETPAEGETVVLALWEAFSAFGPDSVIGGFLPFEGGVIEILTGAES